jgi:peptide/nickel transport system substrate-binding protein
MAWMTSDPDTLPFLTLRTQAWPDQGGFNSSYYSNEDVDELLDQARMSTDPDERAALYRDVQQIVHDEAPWLFVANWRQNAVTTSDVEGFELQPDFNLVLKNVSKN